MYRSRAPESGNAAIRAQPRKRGGNVESRTIAAPVLAACVSLLGVAGCGPSAAEQQRAADFPPGSCVVIEGNESVDTVTSITRVPCEAYHTHVVVSIPGNDEPCPIGLDNRMAVCVRSAVPSPTPYPGGVTAP